MSLTVLATNCLWQSRGCLSDARRSTWSPRNLLRLPRVPSYRFITLSRLLEVEADFGLLEENQGDRRET